MGSASKEVHLNWNNWIRQSHRWISLAFTVGVVTNMAVMSQLKAQEQPPVWVGLMALIPLILLLVTGLYLFALPYAAKWRSGQRAN
jgi:quinol-cytochrome oxidoreductase complex cytochrome b subunit